jgi:hypothetical protein
MTTSGRWLAFASIAKAFDCMTAAQDSSRPKIAVHDCHHECPQLDGKADIGFAELIVRRSSQLDCLFSQFVSTPSKATPALRGKADALERDDFRVNRF